MGKIGRLGRALHRTWKQTETWMRIWTWPGDRAAIEAFFQHSDTPSQAVEKSVDAIIAAVRRRGDRALAEFSLKFDKVRVKPGDFEVSREQLKQAWDKTPQKLRRALRLAQRRI